MPGNSYLSCYSFLLNCLAFFFFWVRSFVHDDKGFFFFLILHHLIVFRDVCGYVTVKILMLHLSSYIAFECSD